MVLEEPQEAISVLILLDLCHLKPRSRRAMIFHRPARFRTLSDARVAWSWSDHG